MTLRAREASARPERCECTSWHVQLRNVNIVLVQLVAFGSCCQILLLTYIKQLGNLMLLISILLYFHFMNLCK